MERESVRVVSNGTIEKDVISEKAGFSSRRKSFVDVINIDEKEKGAKDCALGHPREDRTGVRKCAVNKDSLGTALQERRRPVKEIALNAIVVHLEKKGRVIYLVESLRKVEKNCIYLARLVEAVRKVTIIISTSMINQ